MKLGQVRPATQANRFYTGDAKALENEVDSLLMRHNSSQVYDNLAALIVPHAGYYFSGNVAASAYMSIDAKKKYKRIFLLGPSHHEWLDGASVNTEADYYATPLGNVKVDHETAIELTKADSIFTYHCSAHAQEHCLEVQLPFLQRRLGEVPPIVPIIISTNDYYKLKRMADVLKAYFTDENLFVISSDFSHYPSYQDACEVDAKTGKAIETGDVEEFIATIEANANSGKRNLATSACGEFAIVTLLMMMDNQYDVKHLKYQNSGDIDNRELSRVVGYHSFAILRQNNKSFTLSDNDKKALKGIAFQSIKDSLNGKPIAQPTLRSSILNSKCGAFVSLHKYGRLRGCIGHFGEDYPLHEIVARMARAAAFEDPRFLPVTSDELGDIDIEISVLTPMRRIQSIDEFELHRHGIYIKKGYRSGTFLPQVADEVNWTKEEFIGHCAQDKAGIGWDGWRDAELYVYEAIVF
ncbi:AmmeMemoRadiSam system protein B [Prevotella sp. P6B1]|uniref:AmmeMemoRadiSam system protein B n=1 Tax=Prevotella sp. P6B1 TaxID=1410613 RepID=UPI00051BC1F3|nr:AmmeMemoRadiSam system protein B [Prevotella sp. P6B1]